MRIPRALALSLVLAGCNPGGKAPPKHDAPTGTPGPAAADNSPMKGLVPTQLMQRPSEKGTVVSVGGVEMTIPPGWRAFPMGRQMTWRSPDFQQQIAVQSFTSATPIDDARATAVLVAFTDLAKGAENMLGRFGAHVKLGDPIVTRTPWGITSRFSAIGPLNRVAFHFAAVGPHGAMFVQVDGNTMTDTPALAIALMQSLAGDGEAAKPAPTK